MEITITNFSVASPCQLLKRTSRSFVFFSCAAALLLLTACGSGSSPSGSGSSDSGLSAGSVEGGNSDGGSMPDGGDDDGNIADGGNSGGTPGQPMRTSNRTPGPIGSQRTGEHYNVILSSDLDDETIAVTVFEPTTWVVGQGYPLILHGHGYGGSRIKSPGGFVTQLRDKGYGVVSIDQRGFGDSGGEVRALDPDVEGKDLIQLLDYLETELPWLQYSGSGNDRNLVLGSYGGSYGGGYQHLILAIDPKQRLDAMVPDITWHELNYAFFPNQVFKSVFNLLLSAAGESGSQGQVATFIRAAAAEALLTNDVAEANQTEFKEFGMRAYCRDDRIPEVDALVWQGIRDTLFNFNEGFWNYQCMAEQGGDVRYYTHQSGHIIPMVQASGTNNCGGLHRDDATLIWFDSHLKDDDSMLSTLPEKFCFSIAENDAVETSTVQIGGSEHTLTAATIVVGPAKIATDPQIFDLGAVGSARTIAGIPSAAIAIDGVAGQSTAVDPRIFVGIGKQVGGTGDWQLVDDQVLPLRGFGNHQEMLIGVAERYAADDHVGLMIWGWHEYFASNGSRPGGSVVISGTVSLPFID